MKRDNFKIRKEQKGFEESDKCWKYANNIPKVNIQIIEVPEKETKAKEMVKTRYQENFYYFIYVYM